KVLAAYGIAITAASLARDPDEAAAAARPHLAKGDAVVLKIQSRDIVHKSELGGVRLNLTTEAAVREAADDILRRARPAQPRARPARGAGFPLVGRPTARAPLIWHRHHPAF